MGYWGMAMAYNHPLWEEQDYESAKIALLGTSVAAVFAALLTKRLLTTSEVESNAAYNAGLFFGGTRAGALNKT